MNPSNYLSLSILLLVTLLAIHTNAATFEIKNNCPYTVWPAASPGGGTRLDNGQTWTIQVQPGTKMARIWGRTNCNFDSTGRGSCQTGDCGGFLECTAWGQDPQTLAEYALDSDHDTFDISLVEGFNIPMSFGPMVDGADKCHTIQCTADINAQCPSDLKAPGGCNNPCTVYKTNEYCCNLGSCGPTPDSQFFKSRCPDAYSYPKDDPSSTFACPDGNNYRVVFCP